MHELDGMYSWNIGFCAIFVSFISFFFMNCSMMSQPNKKSVPHRLFGYYFWIDWCKNYMNWMVCAFGTLVFVSYLLFLSLFWMNWSIISQPNQNSVPHILDWCNIYKIIHIYKKFIHLNRRETLNTWSWPVLQGIVCPALDLVSAVPECICHGTFLAFVLLAEPCSHVHKAPWLE